MKTIIITGTSKGLGKCISQQLYRNSILNIATISRTQDFYTTGKLLQIPGDVTDYFQRLKFVNKVIETFGSIDVLINNVGVVTLKPFNEYNEIDFKEIFDMNVHSAFSLSQLCIKQMLLQPTGGHIINIGSTRAITGAPNKSLYSMSKFALRSMTQCINAEFKDKNIYSTIICPGRFDGVMESKVVHIIDFLIKNDIKDIAEIIVGGVL